MQTDQPLIFYHIENMIAKFATSTFPLYYYVCVHGNGPCYKFLVNHVIKGQFYKGIIGK